jgi:hypothetical protein
LITELFPQTFCLLVYLGLFAPSLLLALLFFIFPLALFLF